MEWVAWLRNTEGAAHSLQCRMKLLALWHRALAATHRWAVHLARSRETQRRKVGTHDRCRCHLLRLLLEASE